MEECLKDGRLDLAGQIFARVAADAAPTTLRYAATRAFGSEAHARPIVDRLEALAGAQVRKKG